MRDSGYFLFVFVGNDQRDFAFLSNNVIQR